MGLIERLILSLSNEGSLIFDPFAGVASSGVAALANGRPLWGCETMPEYIAVGKERLINTLKGTEKYRPIEQPLYNHKNSRLSHYPEEWK